MLKGLNKKLAWMGIKTDLLLTLRYLNFFFAKKI